MNYLNLESGIKEFFGSINNLLIVVDLVTCFLVYFYFSSTRIDKLKSVVLVLLTGFSAFFGARVLHVIIERPELLMNFKEIFSRYDGMTFNGSLLFGMALLHESLGGEAAS